MSSEVKTAVVEQGAVVDQSAVDLAIAASEARHRAFTAFAAVRFDRLGAVQSAWERFERVSSLAFLKFGKLAGAYIADGVLAGVDRSELVKELCDRCGCDESTLSRAVRVDYLGRTAEADLSRVSLRRLNALAGLVKTDGESGACELRSDRAKTTAFIGLVARNDRAVSSADTFTASVDSLLGKAPKSKPAAHEAEAQGTTEGQAPAAVQPEAPPVAPTIAQDAASEALAIAEPQAGLTVESAAARAVAALLAIATDIEQRKAVAKAVGAQLMGDYPNLLGAIVNGAAAYVADNRAEEQARSKWAGFFGHIKSAHGNLVAQGIVRG
jgi:hypothetical protein